MSSQQQDKTSNRGFASMPREQVQEIASQGGKARAEKARENREDREQGGSGNADLEDELRGEGERISAEDLDQDDQQ